jgi:hypothetical protein
MSLREAQSRTLLLARESQLLGDNNPSDDLLIHAFQTTRVLLVADEANLSAPVGQHAIVTLVNLIGRLGVTLRLAIPETPLFGFQPPVQGLQLRSGLLDLGNDLLPDYAVELADGDEAVDLALLLGDTHWRGRAEMALRVCGDAWSGWTAPIDSVAQRWAGDFPIGALTAAGIAAPEIFKFALRRLATDLPYPVIPRFLAPVEAAHIRLAPPDTPFFPLALGPVDFISGGAITHAALYTLLHMPQVMADVRIIEPEQSDLSNLNRYMLLRRSQCGELKISTLASWQRADVTMAGVPSYYDGTTRMRLSPLASLALAGVDDIPTRWEVQRAWPEWLGVGATSHFLAMASSHRAGQPCAGCLHPVDDPGPEVIPTVSFVSFWAGLLLTARMLRRSFCNSDSDQEQNVECVPLRLDQPFAYWPKPVAATPRCPLDCPASRTARARAG